MSWWKKIEQALDTVKVGRAIANARDEAVYEQVAREIDSGDLRPGYGSRRWQPLTAMSRRPKPNTSD